MPPVGGADSELAAMREHLAVDLDSHLRFADSYKAAQFLLHCDGLMRTIQQAIQEPGRVPARPDTAEEGENITDFLERAREHLQPLREYVRQPGVVAGAGVSHMGAMEMTAQKQGTSNSPPVTPLQSPAHFVAASSREMGEKVVRQLDLTSQQSAHGPLKQDGTPDMRFSVNKAAYGGYSGFSGSACHRVSRNPAGPRKADGTPDMRYSANRR